MHTAFGVLAHTLEQTGPPSYILNLKFNLKSMVSYGIAEFAELES